MDCLLKGLLEFLLAFLLTTLILMALWAGWKGLEAAMHEDEVCLVPKANPYDPGLEASQVTLMGEPL